MTPEFATWLRAEMEKVQAKLDRLDQRSDNIDITLTKQAGDIAHHIRRTDALERRVEQVTDELRPVREHVARLKGIAWFLGFVITLSGAYAAVQQLLALH